MTREELRRDLAQYITLHYIEEIAAKPGAAAFNMGNAAPARPKKAFFGAKMKAPAFESRMMANDVSEEICNEDVCESGIRSDRICEDAMFGAGEAFDFEEAHESKLAERMSHLSDTFSQYLMYLIKEKNLENVEVYKHAIVDKKTFSKIKNNEDYHPQKLTALCLCMGARLNLDETKDLLARAGYALSPCDKTDVIFSYFIENEIYDMIELDIQLEEHGLPCIIG